MQKLSHCTKCVVIILLDFTEYNISISLFFCCNEHEGGLWSRKRKLKQFTRSYIIHFAMHKLIMDTWWAENWNECDLKV